MKLQSHYVLCFNKLKSDAIEINFKMPITVTANYDSNENLYFISYHELNILVWDVNRKYVEDAFKFAILSLVKNIGNEDNCNLTNKARLIKTKAS